MMSQSGSDDTNIKEYLDNIRRLISSETDMYNKYVKGSPSQRMKNYFDITKPLALNLATEYAPYKKILDNPKISDAGKLDQLIEKAEEIYTSIKESKETGKGSKWKYGGGLHSAIANINPKNPYSKEHDLHKLDEDIQKEVESRTKKSQDNDTSRKSSAPGRIENTATQPETHNPVRRGSSPGRLLSSSSATLYARPEKESGADECVRLLKDIFLLISKSDLNEKIKNEYIKCGYMHILNKNITSEAKVEALFDAAKSVISGKFKGHMHQIVLDIDANNSLYRGKLTQIRHQLQQKVASQQTSRQDITTNRKP